MTNFEKIKNMSDDELASFIAKTSESFIVTLDSKHALLRTVSNVKQWLESEAEE